MSRHDIKEESSQEVIEIKLHFICVGNTCRSITAAIVAEYELNNPDFLQELERSGIIPPNTKIHFTCKSSGIGIVGSGGNAQGNAIQAIIRKYGENSYEHNSISRHRTNNITDEKIKEADMVFFLADKDKIPFLGRGTLNSHLYKIFSYNQTHDEFQENGLRGTPDSNDLDFFPEKIASGLDERGLTAYQYALKAITKLFKKDALPTISDTLPKIIASHIEKRPLSLAPLNAAIQFGNIQAIERLSLTLHKNEQDISGNTPLHIALQKGDYETYKFLLERDAQQSRNNTGEMPIELAYRQGHTDVIEQYFRDKLNMNMTENQSDEKEDINSIMFSNILEKGQDDISEEDFAIMRIILETTSVDNNMEYNSEDAIYYLSFLIMEYAKGSNDDFIINQIKQFKRLGLDITKQVEIGEDSYTILDIIYISENSKLLERVQTLQNSGISTTATTEQIPDNSSSMIR